MQNIFLKSGFAGFPGRFFGSLTLGNAKPSMLMKHEELSNICPYLIECFHPLEMTLFWCGLGAGSVLDASSCPPEVTHFACTPTVMKGLTCSLLGFWWIINHLFHDSSCMISQPVSRNCNPALHSSLPSHLTSNILFIGFYPLIYNINVKILINDGE